MQLDKYEKEMAGGDSDEVSILRTKATVILTIHILMPTYLHIDQTQKSAERMC